MENKTTVTQWGRVFPNGETAWQTEGEWPPLWSTPEGRQTERNAYDAQLSSIGIIPSSATTLAFVTRSMTVSYTEATEIIDPETEE